jgi:hypothetical protein
MAGIIALWGIFILHIFYDCTILQFKNLISLFHLKRAPNIHLHLGVFRNFFTQNKTPICYGSKIVFALTACGCYNSVSFILRLEKRVYDEFKREAFSGSKARDYAPFCQSCDG